MNITFSQAARVELDRLIRESQYTSPGVRIRITGVG